MALVGQYVKGHLYLLESGFGLAHCKRLLECIDTQEDFNPKKIIAYGLRFESARVRELDEALRSYRNKKGSELEVILRWF